MAVAITTLNEETKACIDMHNAIPEMASWQISDASRDRLSRLSLDKKKRSTNTFYEKKTI